MGLFGTKKEIHVASSPYNMAGDELLRPNYLKYGDWSSDVCSSDLI